jgi:hypothetical protein
MAASPRVDVHPTTARVTRLHTQFGGLTPAHDVHVNAFYAMFMEFMVVAKADDVLQ